MTHDGLPTRLDVMGNSRDVHSVEMALPGLRPGAYRVRWHVVSADGHAIMVSYVFQVGAGTYPLPPDAAAFSESSVGMGLSVFGAPLLAALLRGLALGCLMALVGVLLFAAWPGTLADERTVRLTRWLGLGVSVLLGL